MGRYFGTDGVRGVANSELTPEFAYRLGRCGASMLTQRKERPKVVIGRDTRISGEMLESSLIAGLLSTGTDVVRLGVVGTPAVAYLTRHLQADAGIMISASHNPFYDNGIKLFGADGFKLSDEQELAIEKLLDEGEDLLPRPTGEQIGRVTTDHEAVEDYLYHLSSSIDTDLCGMHIVVDCAHGAAYQLAPFVLRELGADVTAIHANPDGININVDCGSTHPKCLQEEVLKKQAHLGLAFDGDADRLIAVDEKGRLVDGDQIMYICATYLQERGLLRNNTLVTTVMSNMGLFKALEKAGISSETTQVGDRYVIEKMREVDAFLGGEQSGHIIFLDHTTTGDGLLSAIQLLRVIKEKGQTLGDLSQKMVQYPQVLVNVPVKTKDGWEQNLDIRRQITETTQAMGEEGRLLVRPSGTEPLIRVMAEGPSKEWVKGHVDQVVGVIQRELG